jgi:hypothetical protein
MSKRAVLDKNPAKHPHNFFEEIALSNEWGYERLSDQKSSIEVDGFPCRLTVVNQWDSRANYLDIFALFHLRVPRKKRLEVFEILTALSLDTRVGSFGLCPEEELPFYRHGLFTYPRLSIRGAQISDIFQEMLTGGEKLCQAFYFLLEENKTSQEALFASLIDVAGEC